jgi:hypothetical protein
MPLLKLLAFDVDDLDVVSAHLQDAIVKIRNLIWQAEEKRFIAVFHRFAWEEEICKITAGKGRHVSERRLSALRFDRVLTVRASGVDRNRPDDVLALLALRFYASEAPGGTVEFIFAGNPALRLEVECIEA